MFEKVKKVIASIFTKKMIIIVAVALIIIIIIAAADLEKRVKDLRCINIDQW